MLIILSACASLAGCRARVAALEPTDFLGVKLGRPLAASVRVCKTPGSGSEDKKVCVANYTDISGMLENTPETLPGVFYEQSNGVVDSLMMTVNEGDTETMHADIVQRYGEPTSTSFGMDIWSWPNIEIMYRPWTKKYGYGMVSVYALPRPPASAHRNPF